MKNYSNKHGYYITIISLLLCSFFFRKDFSFIYFIGYFIGTSIIVIFISSIVSSFINFKYFGKVLGVTSLIFSIFLLLPQIVKNPDKTNIVVTEKKDLIIHPLEKPYDSTANIFNEERYIKKDILKIIKEFGPMSIRKEKNIWYIYRFDDTFFYTGSRFKLFRVPFDSIYNFKSTKEKIKNKFFYIDPLGDRANIYLIDYTDRLKNIYSAEGLNYDSKNDIHKDYKLTNEIKIEKFGFKIKENDSIDYVLGSAKIYNTTKNNIKNIKLKISLYDNYIDGKLIFEDTILINDIINKRELKIVEINFKPQKKFKSQAVTPINIEIINYDIF